MATQPRYVAIAGDLAQRIRRGDLAPGSQLASHDRLAAEHGVSEIVIRRSMALLQRMGLVHAVERRGTFVTRQPTLVRVSPERQQESAEASFGHESADDVEVERTTDEVPATEELAEIFGIGVGDPLSHTVTRVREGGRPVSISDTYQPGDDRDPQFAVLEETLAARNPAPGHDAWLEVPTTQLTTQPTTTIHQRFHNAAGQVVMVSDVTYPGDRYGSFTFRMILSGDEER